MIGLLNYFFSGTEAASGMNFGCKANWSAQRLQIAALNLSHKI